MQARKAVYDLQRNAKRWISLLLAATLCMTAGGIPVLAAESKDENTTSETEMAEQLSETGENEGENTAVTLPAISEDRPVVSIEPDEGAADDSTGGKADEPAQGDDNEPIETPEEPENPSEDEQSAQDNTAAEQSGESSDAVEPSEPQHLPGDFFQRVSIGQSYDEKTGVVIPFDEENPVKKDGSCVVRFDYKIPEGGMKAGQEYTFTVTAPLKMGVKFSIKNEDGAEIATGELGEMKDDVSQGKLIFKPEYSDYCTKTGTTGYFYVGTVFEKSDVGNGGRQDISIEVTGGISTSSRVDFELSKVEPNLDLKKTGDSAKYLNDHEIEWMLTADPSATGTDYITSLNITDDLNASGLIKKTTNDENGEMISDYVENSAVVTLHNGQQGKGTLTYKNGKLSYTCEKVADSETVPNDLQKDAWPITITFRTKYNPEKLTPRDGKVSFSNTASAFITAPQWTKNPETGKPELKDDPTNSKTVESNTAKTDIAYASIWKDGWMVKGDRIHWIVKAKNSMLQKDPYIKDVLPAHLMLSGDITRKITDGEGNVLRTDTLKQGTDFTVTKVGSGSSEHYELNILLDPDTDKEQIIEYETKFDDDAEVKDILYVINRAYLYVGDQKDFVAKEQKTVNFGRTLMSKSGNYNRADHTITWTIKVIAVDNMDLDDTILKDTFIQTVYYNNSDTAIKQTYVDGSMKLFARNVGDKAEKEINPIPSENLKWVQNENGEIVGFEIDVKEHKAKIIRLTYQTKLDEAAMNIWGSNNGGFKVKNKLALTATGLPSGAEITGEVSGNSQMLIKTAGIYNPSRHEIEWKLTVNQNNMKVNNGVITDVLNSKDWEFVQDSIQASDDMIDSASFGTDANGNPSMSIKLKPFSKQITITYHTKITNNGLLLSNKAWQTTLSNTATLIGDQVGDKVTATASKNIGQDVLQKTVSFDQCNTVTWTVDVNRNHATIEVPEDKKIGIEDTLQKGLSYVDGSMKVYKVHYDQSGKTDISKGTLLTKGKDYNVSYASTDRRLTITWNTNKITDGYRIIFDTNVLVSGTYSNTVRFIGFGESGYTSDAASGTWSLFSGGFSKLPSTMGVLRIVKQDGNTNAKLAGVKFAIEDKDGNVFLDAVVTDSNGEVQIPLPVGTWYIREVETANGSYELPSDRIEVNVTHNSAKPTEQVINNYSDKSVATLRPKVIKKVVGRGAPETSFTFKLSAENGAPMPEKGGETATVDMEQNAAEKTAYFGEIQYTDEGTYTYTIQEDGTNRADRFDYDTTAYKMKVKVSRRTSDGQLIAEATYYGKDNAVSSDALTITNKYHRFTTFEPKVTKQVVGSSAPEEIFTFKLEEENGAPMPANAETTAKDGETASFGSIEYTEPGVYSYTITETAGTTPRFTYDTAKHTLTVVVQENEDGTLSASALYDDNKLALTVVNTYRGQSSSGGGGGSTRPSEPDKPVEPDKPTEPINPDQPTEPTEPDKPSEPETPTAPDHPKTPPHYPVNRVPDANKPDSPDTIIIDDGDTPLGEFHREEEPDGTFIYINDDGIPLGVLLEERNETETPTDTAKQPIQTNSIPKTGTPWSTPMLLLIALLCAGGAVLSYWVEKKMLSHKEEKK